MSPYPNFQPPTGLDCCLSRFENREAGELSVVEYGCNELLACVWGSPEMENHGFSCDEWKGFLELYLSFPIIGGSKLRFFGMDLPIPEYIDMTNLAP